MTSLPTLSTHLQTLTDHNRALQALIHRLSKLNFGSTSDEGRVRLELTAEISENLKSLEGELELLKEEVEGFTAGGRGNGGGGLGQFAHARRESEKETERIRVLVGVRKLGEDLRLSRIQFQKAQRLAKRAAEAAKAKERELLFAGALDGSSAPVRRKTGKELSADEVLVNASSDVTAALRRTHQLMQSELSRSRFAQETLEQSTAALADLGEHYTNLTTLLSSSRSLLTSLLQSQKSDTWYLETAFYILVTTIIWLVFRRLLYGPLWWILYLPLKLVYKATVIALAAVGVTGQAKGPSAGSVSQSTSLIVKSSATGRPPVRMSGHAPSMRVGGGGFGAKSDPSAEGSLSRSVGQMAEGTQSVQPQGSPPPEAQQEKKEEEGGQGQEQARRGDGQPLLDSDKPRNPKKRMWDEDVENAKREAEQKGKDEL